MPEGHFLVLGGRRGIGKVLVERLAASVGNHVSVLARTAHEGGDVLRQSQHVVDVADQRALLKCLDAAVAQHGKLLGAVFLQRHRANGDEFDRDLAVALSATKNTIEHLIDKGHFVNDRQASIVVVSSVADHYIAPEQPLGYHVAKAGLAQLARYYAFALGSRGIRVNVVSPCVVVKREAAEFYARNDLLVERINNTVPLGRAGTPDDIVDAITFFMSEQASYVTGQTLVVDGGLTLRSHESLIRDFSQGIE